MPRPTGAAAREMDERIAAIAARPGARRKGYAAKVTVTHVDPATLARPKTEEHYGWTPTERTCRWQGCGKQFMPTTPAQAYCSGECKAEAGRAQRRITDKGKRERQRAKKRQVKSRVCRLEGCECVFVPEYPRSFYCSPEHSAEAKRRRRRVSRPSSTTEKAMAELDRIEDELGENLPQRARDYIVLLWKKVNEDPDCPPHVYDRLERLLELPPGTGSTMRAVDAG